MKKNVAALWAFATSFVFVTFMMIAQANAQFIDRSLSLRELARQLQSPEDIARFMWRHFQFETDERNFGSEEYWQSPEEFLQNGKGDCEDFALFAREMLKLNGVPAFLMNVYGNGFAHTVCVFKEGGTYSIIDGTRVIRFEAKHLKELASDIYPFWKDSAVVTESPETSSGRILSKFERMARAEHLVATSA